MADPEWTPEKEREEDPGKLQSEAMKLMREFMDQQKEEKAKREAQEKAELGEAILPATLGVVAAYQPPLLSKILDRYEMAWKAICIRFEDPSIRTEIFRQLIHIPFRISDEEEESAG